MSHVPYTMMLANAGGWMIYGCIANPRLWTLVIANAIGVVVASLLLVLYLRYLPREETQRRRLMAIHCAIAGGILLILAVAAAIWRHELSIGIICSVLAVCMFASPLVTMKEVIVTRSSQSLPTGMIVAALVCTTLWTAYGLRLGKLFISIPNGIGFTLALMQLVLLLVFPKRPKDASLVQPDGDVSQPLMDNRDEL